MTRLTDKEREALHNCDRTNGFTAILASCVTRLNAPVGGLETVAWQNPSIKSVSTDAAVSELRTYGEKGVAMADSYSEPLVLRSAAEAKIAGLVEALEAVVLPEKIELMLRGLSLMQPKEFRDAILKHLDAVSEARALIEAGGGEDANND